MAWFLLTIAGLLEVVWAYFLKQSDGFTRPGPTAIAILTMVASFALLALSMRTLPLGTAYAVWTGIGSLGAFMVGLVVLGESTHPTRLLAAALMMVLLKVSRTKHGRHNPDNYEDAAGYAGLAGFIAGLQAGEGA